MLYNEASPFLICKIGLGSSVQHPDVEISSIGTLLLKSSTAI